jgi:5'-3' exonuclease
MKANIQFDGNYILHKNVFTLHKMKTLYGDLYAALTNNIEKYTSMHSWDNVFIVSDTRKKSWRKKFLGTYKGNRTTVEGIDWDWVYETYEQWKKDMSEKYNVLSFDHIEGDDWITTIVLKTKNKGYSNVIISSDNDLNQLLGYRLSTSGKPAYIVFKINDHNGQEKLYMPEGWDLYFNDLDDNRNEDVFSLDNSHQWMHFFTKLTENWHIVEINPHESLIIKLLSGDKSDNIESVYKTMLKSGKLQNIGTTSAEKMWNFYRENFGLVIDTDSDEFRNNLITCVERVKNLQFSDTTRSGVIENINRNIMIIELHYRHFPDWVTETIIEKMSEINIR